MTRKTAYTLLTIGVINVIHGGIHLLQVAQSALMVSYSLNHDHDNWTHKMFESPWMALVWAAAGIITIVIALS